ncbi:MAG: heparinase II/III-family protein, partial [Calditrichia bacterium]
GWEKDSHYCLFDFGKIAHGVYRDETPSAAHGHADILSFEICVSGKPLIIDPGFYTYFGPLEWHRYFRATRGHNNIEVNGTGQAQHESRISWSCVSEPRKQLWVFTSEWDLVSAAVDRFAGLNENVSHHRFIFFVKEAYCLIFDLIDSSNKGREFTVENFLHFSPGDLQLKNDTFYRQDQPVLYMKGKPGFASRIENGGPLPEQGWTAPGYGQKIAAPVIHQSAKTRLPLINCMLFPMDAKVRDLSFQSKEQGLMMLEIQSDNSLEKVYLNPLQKVIEMEDVDNCRTNALLTRVVFDKKSPIRFEVAHCSQLENQNVSVLQDYKAAAGFTVRHNQEFEDNNIKIIEESGKNDI